MKKAILFFVLVLSSAMALHAQTGKVFWFVAPEVTSGHNDRPIKLRLATSDSASSVTVSLPANGTFTPITVSLAANSASTIDLTAYIDIIENKPPNTILNNGILINSTQNITAYYEVDNSNNNEFFALKGESALGTEFYTPFQTYFNNGTYTPTPYSAFDIVATEDNTTILIYPKTAITGHAALTSFTITLNKGQTWSGANPTSTGTGNPAGTIITSSKPIAVTVKTDSDANDGCRDLGGDQIVPTDIIGNEYIVVRGSVTNERVFILATENNTVVKVNGTTVGTLFGTETLDYPLTLPHTYISSSKPVYVYHVSGFGCELGSAILPPLNCAGSQQISFVRSTNEYFGLNLLVKTGSEGNFTLNGSAGIINSSSFSLVPGTGGQWMAAQISFNTTNIPVGSANLIKNSSSIFSMGIINGGSSTGCRYGYFSEFKAPIKVNAGPDKLVCANTLVNLSGTVSGGASTGAWTSSGSGFFVSGATSLNAVYKPSLSDLATGVVEFTLTSTSICFPEEDKVRITFTLAPTAEAGSPQTVCANNPIVNLSGAITVALGSLWTGGAGTYTSNTSLNPVYTPTPGEITTGSLYMKLTTTGNGTCNPVSDSVLITISPAPTANAGIDQTLCGNNANITLNGSIATASGAIWSGGGGTFNPSNTAVNAIYTPTSAEVAAGSLVLTLTTTGNGSCLQVANNLQITFTLPPIVNAGSDQTLCANNASASLSGSVSLPASGGIWSGGLGNFTPGSTSMNTMYAPTNGEVLGGFIVLTLTSTGNVNCNPVTDNVKISFTAAPEINAGADRSICANTPSVVLNGSGLAVSTGAVWTGGAGSFNPSSTTLNATYNPTPAEIAAGSVLLTLSTTGNGSCNQVSDGMVLSITPGPAANAGADQTLCGNNANVTLNGNISVAAGGVWSGGGGTFNPSNTALNAVYTPLQSEITAGGVTLSLSTSGNGSCIGVSESVRITFTVPPVVNAGSDQVVCSNNASAVLSGAVSAPAAGGQWSGGLGTFSPNTTSLNVSYSPTSAELLAGNVKLTLSSVGNGSCTVVSDELNLSFSASPEISAGADHTVCGNNAAVSLTGSGLKIASGVIWAGGNGTFAPSNTSLNPTYTPTPTEISNGSVSLTITTTGNNTCSPVSDATTISITTAPMVAAGADQTLCGNNPNVTLNGSVQVAPGAAWSGGAGTFNPSNTALNAIYTPTAAELATGSLNLRLTSAITSTCNTVIDDIIITYTLPPTADAGANQSLCANNATGVLTGKVSLPASGGVWSGGLGTFTPNNSTLNVSYAPTNAEIQTGMVTLVLTTSGNGNCAPAVDEMNIIFTAAPEIFAGADQVICANNAKVTLAGGGLKIANGSEWNGGMGTFLPSRLDPAAQYTPSVSEIDNGVVALTLVSTGNGNCTAVSDNILISITDAPTANAGADQILCTNKAAVSLAGSVTVAGGGLWKGGNGSYTPGPTNLNSEYIPTPAEIAAGSLTLTLETTGFGSCKMVSDVVTVNFTTAPSAEAGTNQTLCENNAAASLIGLVTAPATGGIWSGGLGSFSPDNASLSAVYSPTTSEIASGSVTLTLTTTGNGNCTEVKDNVRLTYTAAPEIAAGTDQVVCANNSTVNLNGSGLSVATGAVWSGGGGIYSPSSTTLNAIYIPTATEKEAGSVMLTLTTTGNNNCTAVSDKVIISITPAPKVFAGNDVTACANNAAAIIAGSILNAGGGTWSGGSGRFNPSNTSTVTSYTPSDVEVSTGFINLILTSAQNGNCSPEMDTMKLSIVKSPVVNAGVDQKICANKAEIVLNGKISEASGGVWSGGLGIYSASNSDLAAFYTPTTAEVSSGTITLRLSSTGNGTCNTVNDEVTIDFTAAPAVNAGADQSVCANNALIALSGTVDVASGGSWTGGEGSFTGGANTLSTTYAPSASELSTGTILLTLNSTGNGKCNAVTDNIVIIVTASPKVDAGADQTPCSNNPETKLNGIVQNAMGGTWSGGQGIFNPSPDNINAIYSPTAEEITTGFVTLQLSSAGNGNCNPVVNETKIVFAPKPSVTVGNDIVVCGNNPDTRLTGSVAIANGGIWSGGLGIFTPNNNTLDAMYTPTVAEVNAGTLKLILTSTGNGNCNSVNKDLKVTFTSSPTVSAGGNQTVCANNAAIELDGSFEVSSGILWSGGEGVFLPTKTSPKATYVPTVQEIENGSIALSISSTGNANCNAVSDVVDINITPAPIVGAGSDKTVCVDNLNAELNGFVSGKTTSGRWSTVGSGRFLPTPDQLNATYQASKSDSMAGRVNLVLTSTNNSTCKSVADTVAVFILPAGSADAGTDQSACANTPSVQLNGKLSGGATSATWMTSGSGRFVPSNKILDALYVPGASDTTNHSVSLTLTSNSCNAGKDNIVLNFIAASKPYAGLDQALCSSATMVSINGQIFGGNVASWKTSGSGSFEKGLDTLNNVYVLSAQDVLRGSVSLVLSTPGTNLCPGGSDTLMVNMVAPGSVRAGDDQIVCADNSEIELSGQTFGDGLWSSSGTGSFVPSRVDMQTTYIASGADIAAGSIRINLASTSCEKTADSLVITFIKNPESNAGADKSVCANNAVIDLTGSVSGAVGGTWSTAGTGIFQSGPTTTAAKYTLSTSDVDLGFAYVYLTTTGNGKCKPAIDSAKITITPKPLVDAGIDQSICLSSGLAQLKGNVTSNAGTGTWKTLGNGFFTPDESSLDADYRFSQSDSANKSVTLILESTDNENCSIERDTIKISTGNTVFVSAGPDIDVCTDAESFELPGLISGGSASGMWETSGDGSFFPNNKHLSPFYKTTSIDPGKDSILFVLTSTNNGLCLPGKDSVIVHFIKPPAVYAGRDKEICKGSKTVELSDATSKHKTVLWTSLGTGTFLADNSEKALYYISKNDSLNNLISLVLQIKDHVCSANDTVRITFGTSMLADAGRDQNLCGAVSSALLHGTTSPNSKARWSTLGSGTFITSDTNLSVTYKLSLQDSTSGNVKLVLFALGDANCATGTDTITIIRKPLSALSLGADQTICPAQATIALSAVGTNVSGIRWQSASNGKFSSDTSLSTNYTLTLADSISRSFWLSATSNVTNCGTISDTIKYMIGKSSAPGFTFTDACSKQEVIFKDTSSVLSGTRQWAFGDNNFSQVQQPAHTFERDKSYQVVLTHISREGCKDSIVKSVLVRSSPSAMFKLSTDKPEAGEDIKIIDQSQGASTWKWNLGDGSATLDASEPTIVYATSGTYTISQIVTNELNCADTALVEVTVRGNLILPPKLPNAFSPNQDDKNNIFYVRGGPFKTIDFKIYNVWGELIYNSDDPKAGWDGTWKGLQQPLGVYVYTVKATTIDNKVYTRSGDVTLIK